MGYPTTVDIGSTAQKTGLAQISGGALQWGIPGVSGFTGQATFALAANTVYYSMIFVTYTHVMTAWELDVTTGPAGSANIRVGIYQADGTLQPSGAPIYDSGAVAVANGFTGIKTATGLSITLLPGVYLVCVNADTAMTLQDVQAPSPFLVAALGSTPNFREVKVAQTFGAFPTPGTAWTSVDATGSSAIHFVAWQWTE
jgi:hypothetical protein